MLTSTPHPRAGGSHEVSGRCVRGLPRDGSRFAAPPNGKAPRAASVSPTLVLLRCECAGEDHPRGVYVRVVDVSAVLALKGATSPRARRDDATGSALLRGVGRRNLQQARTEAPALVGELAAKFAPALREQRPIESGLGADVSAGINPAKLRHSHRAPVAGKAADSDLSLAGARLDAKAPTALALESWVAGIAAEEADEGAVEVAQSLLENIGVRLAQPRMGALGLGEFRAALGGVAQARSIHSPRHASLLKPSVPHRPRAACPALKRGCLFGRRVKPIAVAKNLLHKYEHTCWAGRSPSPAGKGPFLPSRGRDIPPRQRWSRQGEWIS